MTHTEQQAQFWLEVIFWLIDGFRRREKSLQLNGFFGSFLAWTSGWMSSENASEWHWPGHVYVTLLFPRLIWLCLAPQQFTRCFWKSRESQRDQVCSLPTLAYSPSPVPWEPSLLCQLQPWSGLSLVDIDIWTNKPRVWSWLLMSLQFGFLWHVCTDVMAGIPLLFNNHNHIGGREDRADFLCVCCRSSHPALWLCSCSNITA